MFETFDETLKPMSISEIVSKSLSILSRRYFSFVLPFLVISLVEWLFSIFFRGFTPVRPVHPVLIGFAILGAFGSLFLTLFFDAISIGIVTQLAADEFLGKETSLKKSVNSALDVVVSLIVGIIIVSVIVIIGLILFIIPGIIFLVWFCLTPIVIVLEKRGATEAMSKSKELTKGSWFHVFGVLILIAIILLVASTIGNVISSLLAPVLPKPLSLLIEKIILSLINPVSGVILTALYFDLLARKRTTVVSPLPPAPYIEPKTEVKETQPITYRYCPYCGSPLPPGAKFCPRCGAAIE
ncbi:MAG: zinc ribbon domain-containing protein [Candidatus Baldrarchaeota archaeon]